MSYNATLRDGTVVTIVEKTYEGQVQVLVAEDGSRYTRLPSNNYITPLEVAEALVEEGVIAEEETEEETPAEDEAPAEEETTE